jgi:hypothetical protein
MAILCILLEVETVFVSYVSISFTLQKGNQPILLCVMSFIDVWKLLSPKYYINTFLEYRPSPQKPNMFNDNRLLPTKQNKTKLTTSTCITDFLQTKQLLSPPGSISGYKNFTL